MKKIIAGVSAAALFGLSAFAGIAPAAAARHSNFQQQDQYIGNYCGKNPSGNQCNDWQANHTHWSNNEYRGFYRYHRNDSGFGDSAVAALFGMALGVAVQSTLDNGSDHTRACERTYHSYNVGSDTYLGNDGSRHPCRV